MIYISKVPLPQAPFSAMHVALYAYFPQAARDSRPYVWRVADEGRSAVMLSAMRPTTDCAEIAVEAARTYQFALTYKRAWMRGGRQPVEITSMTELRDRLTRWAGERGGHVGFSRFDKMRAIEFQKCAHRVRLPIVDAAGSVYVSDAAQFERMLAAGGPGTGKAYGLGMWWLPEVMGPALAAISRGIAA